MTKSSEMEPIKISIDDYVLAGGGANGESYYHRKDPSVMLKLYFPGMINQPLDEMLLARKVYDLGVPTPFARACGDHPEKVAEYAVDFAVMCKHLHAIHVNMSEFESVKVRYLRLLGESPYFTPQEKDRLSKFIIDAPDSDTALHGDLHFGNAIFVIDLGDFGYGHPYFDLGMLYLCCKLSGEEFNKEYLHVDNATASAFWDAFVPEYFGTDLTMEEVDRLILPYAALKTIMIDRDCGCRRKEFHDVIDRVFFG